MAGLIHFVPDVQGISWEAFPEYGLSGVLCDVKKPGDDYIVMKTESGPYGRSGAWLWPKDAAFPDRIPKNLGYQPNYQEWRPSKAQVNGKPQRYIGWWKNDPPSTEDMRRKTEVQGYLVDCGYEKRWSIPIARLSATSVDQMAKSHGSLPTEYGFDAAGKVVPEVLPEYSALWDKSALVWDFFEQHDNDRDDKPFPIPDDEITQWLVDAAIECLAVNYRLSFEEIVILRELKLIRMTPEIAGRILRALIDFQEFEVFKKKETAETSASPEESSKSSHGEQGDSLASIQAEAN